MSEALDEILEMMETLKTEYSQQDQQLNRIHAALTVLEYGYNSLRQQLSSVECTVSEILTLSRSASIGLDDHVQQVETKIGEIETCIDDAESTLDVIKSTIHPCGEGDWKVAVKEDYSIEGGDPCPNGWVMFQEPTSGRRFCGGETVGNSSSEFCDSAIFNVSMEYGKVCGRIIGYGHALNRAFGIGTEDNISVPYVDGVSLTYGGQSSRKHIWTFAASRGEDVSVSFPGSRDGLCPCHPQFVPGTFVPSFIGSNYFCEAGLEFLSVTPASDEYYLEDPLWDGRDCHEMCCSSAPYFVKALNSTTNDALEVRICNHGQSASIDQNIIVEKIEIFIQ